VSAALHWSVIVGCWTLDVFRQTRSKRSTFNFHVQRSMKTKDERVKGIEPSCVAWEATVLPLNYTRGWRK
jgi:hypothetical protein